MPNEDLSNNWNLREHILAWLRANDIDPKLIPARPHMTLTGDQLTTDVHVTNDAGRIQIDPQTDEVARKTVTYTVTVPPPGDVAEWLLPRCPECGR